MKYVAWWVVTFLPWMLALLLKDRWPLIVPVVGGAYVGVVCAVVSRRMA